MKVSYQKLIRSTVVLTVLLVFSFVFFLTPDNYKRGVDSDRIDASELSIGDYIENFGTDPKTGQPLKWRVVNIDGSGRLLIRLDRASRLGATTAFSEAEVLLEAYYNSFTEKERLAIDTISQRQIARATDIDDGTVQLGNNQNFGTVFHNLGNANDFLAALDNFDQAIHYIINDKIFLPDLRQLFLMSDHPSNVLAEARQLRNALGESYHLLLDSYGQPVEDIWTRTPLSLCPIGSSQVVFGRTEGIRAEAQAMNFGFVPMLFVSPEANFEFVRESNANAPLRNREQAGFRVFGSARLGSDGFNAIQIGDYIENFGIDPDTGQPLKWRVVGKDANGLLVRTDRSLSQVKAFSMWPGVGSPRNFPNSEFTTTLFTNSTSRSTHGTNYWGHPNDAWANQNYDSFGVFSSSIRLWLNDQFYNSFTSAQRAMIQTVPQQQLSWWGDSRITWTADGHTTTIQNQVIMPQGALVAGNVFVPNIDQNWFNIGAVDYNSFARYTISDKIFLPSFEQARQMHDIGITHGVRNVAEQAIWAVTPNNNPHNFFQAPLNSEGVEVNSFTRTPLNQNANVIGSSLIALQAGVNFGSGGGTNGGIYSLSAMSQAAIAPMLFIAPSASLNDFRASNETLALNNGREQAGFRVFRMFDISNQAITANVLQQTFNHGNPVTFAANQIILVDGNHTLVPNVDFEIIAGSWLNNVNASENTASVRVRGIGTYTGERTINFTIARYELALSATNQWHSIGWAPGLSFSLTDIPGLTIQQPPGLTITLDMIQTQWYTWGASGLEPVTGALSDVGAYLAPDFWLDHPNYTLAGFEFTLSINPREMEDVTVTFDRMIYNGSAHTPNMTVTFMGLTLVEGVDFEVTWWHSDLTNAGDKYVWLHGISTNFSGEARIEFEIERAETIIEATLPNNAVFDFLPHFVSNALWRNLLGHAMLDGLSIYYREEGNTDFLPTGPVIAGTHEVRIYLENNNFRAEPFEGTFTILPRDIADPRVYQSGTITDLIFNNTPHEPILNFHYIYLPELLNILLVQNQDFQVAFANNVNAGINTATATITGIGNFRGTIDVNFSIGRAIANIVAHDITLTYNGGPIAFPAFWTSTISGFGMQDTELEFLFRGISGTVYESTAAPTNVGTYEVIITLNHNNFQASSIMQILTVSAFDLSHASANNDLDAWVSAQTFTGSALTPIPNLLFLANNSSLVLNTDFTIISYANNTNAGNASVTVRGIGNFSGDLIINFLIVRAWATINALDNTTAIFDGSGFIINITWDGAGTTGNTSNLGISFVGISGTVFGPSIFAPTTVGTYQVSIHLDHPNFMADPITRTFIILPADLNISDISALIANVNYNAFEQTPTINITHNNPPHLVNQALVLNTDFEIVSWQNNRNAGLASVVVRGIGNYTGERTINFTINRASLTVTVNNQEREFMTPNPSVFSFSFSGFLGSDNATNSLQNTGFNVTTNAVLNSSVGFYDLFLALGTASSINYEFILIDGQLEVVAINMVSSRISITLDQTLFTYTGFVQSPNIIVLFDGATLVSAVDFNVLVTNNLNAGTANIEISGLANFTGSASRNFTIERAVLTVTANNQARGFGANNPTFTATTSGWLASDNDSLISGVWSFSTDAVLNSPMGSYKIIVSQGTVLDLLNYTFNFVEGTLTISGIDLSHIDVNVNLSFITTTYTGVAQTPTITIFFNALTLVLGVDYNIVSVANNINTGNAVITIEGIGNFSGIITRNFTINRASLIINVDNATRQFNTTNPTFSASFSGFVNNEDEAVLRNLNFITSATFNSIGNHTITVNPAIEADNYDITVINGILNITAFDMSNDDFEVVLAFQTTIYTGFAQTPAVTSLIHNGAGIFTLIQGTHFIVSYSNNSQAGAAVVTIIGDGVFFSGSITRNFTIERAVLTITANNQSRLFGVANPAFTYTISGFVGGQNASVLTGNITFESSAISTSLPGTFPITIDSTLTTVEATNYSFVFTPGVLTINAILLDNSNTTVTLSETTVVYNGLAHEPAVTVIFNGQPLSAFQVSYSNNLNAGIATVTVSAEGGYSGTFNLNFTIQRVVLTVTANDQSRAFGEANPNFSYTISGFVAGENVSVLNGNIIFMTTANLTSLPGTFPITIDSVLTTITADNYEFIFVSGNLTITVITLDNNNTTVTLSETSVVYNGLVQTPTVTVVFGSLPLVNGIDFQVSYNDNLNAGTATVTITAEGGYSGSFTLNFIIEKAVLTITANNQSRSFGETNPAFTYTISGFVAGESASVLSGNIAFTTIANINSLPGSFAIVIDSSLTTISAINYLFTFVSGTLTINVITLDNTNTTISLAQTSVVYNGLAQMPAVTVIFGSLALVSEIDFQASYQDNINAGMATVVINLLGGYTGSFTLNFMITPAHLTITVNNQTRGYGQLNPQFTYTITGFVNNETQNIALSGSFTLSTLATETSMPGNFPITINTSGVTIVNGNYSFQIINEGTLTITYVTLTADHASLSAGSFVYSGLAHRPNVTIIVEGILVLDSYFDVHHTNNINAGTATITVTVRAGSGYLGSFTVNFVIERAILTVTADNQTRLFGAVNPLFTFMISGFVNNENSSVISGNIFFTTSATALTLPGNVAIVIDSLLTTASTTNYEFNFVSGNLNIVAITLDNSNTNLSIADDSFIFSGLAHEPAVTVITSGASLVLNRDFQVVYTNNINAGTATATITALGGYSGTFTLTFLINRAVGAIEFPEVISDSVFGNNLSAWELSGNWLWQDANILPGYNNDGFYAILDVRALSNNFDFSHIEGYNDGFIIRLVNVQVLVPDGRRNLFFILTALLIVAACVTLGTGTLILKGSVMQSQKAVTEAKKLDPIEADDKDYSGRQ
ncbi:MAG: MBG domain-containing protein [Erysipelotrichales bacterium]|nr:MBG domain-containing protein [Erysipelotrichales bacterium]